MVLKNKKKHHLKKLSEYNMKMWLFVLAQFADDINYEQLWKKH